MNLYSRAASCLRSRIQAPQTPFDRAERLRNRRWSGARARARRPRHDPAAPPKVEDRAPIRLAGATRAEIVRALAEIGAPERELNMRASQLWHWIYHRGAREFLAMRNIARPLLDKLSERCTLARPEIVAEQVSADGTRKWLLRMPPAYLADKGAEIECVYIPESDRGTLCVSSQVGCTLNCAFCHTGTMALVRNLTAAEIVGQVLVARDRLGDFPGGVAPADGLVPSGEGVRAVSNVVFMGMGEPLYNFDAVRDAIAILTDGEGLALSKRRITVSTSGVVPEMARLGHECGTMLAVSLHATNNALRDELVPLNRKYPIEALLKACRDYPGAFNARRITFEYVMLKRVNDWRRTPRRSCACSRACPPRSTSFRSTLGPEAPSNVRTGRRSSAFRKSSSTRATRAPCARRAAATFWPPAASSRARAKNCGRGRA